MNSLIEVFKDKLTSTHPLEVLEDMGEVKTDTSFRGGYEVCVSLGKYGDVYLKIWGHGRTTTQAARDCLDRVQKAQVKIAGALELKGN